MRKLRQFAVMGLLGVVAVVSGCAERPASVPSNAALMTEGNGNQLTFRPTEYGRVYVADQNSNLLLYQGEIDRDQTVQVIPREDRILVAGRPVSERMLDDGHQYRIFFEPVTKERVVRYRETVVEEKPLKPRD